MDGGQRDERSRVVARAPPARKVAHWWAPSITGTREQRCTGAETHAYSCIRERLELNMNKGHLIFMNMNSKRKEILLLQDYFKTQLSGRRRAHLNLEVGTCETSGAENRKEIPINEPNRYKKMMNM